MTAALMASCASSTANRMPEVRPIDEDQLALLPAGADGVIDIDMEQLRTWAPARRLFSMLPRDARQRLDEMGVDPWRDLDGLVMSLSGMGAQPAFTMLLRGDLEVAKISAGLTQVMYGESKLWENSERAVAKLSPRMLVMGSPVDVRRVVDLVRGQGQSLRDAQRELVTAFGRAPSAKSGRPAVIAALAPSPALRERLKTDELPGGDYEWLNFVFAVGDGFELMMIGKAASAQVAASLTAQARASLDQLRERPLVRVLNIARFLSDITLCPGAKKCLPFSPDEVRMVYRLPGSLLDQMLGRVEQVMAPRSSR
jgi:hypothetical protein